MDVITSVDYSGLVFSYLTHSGLVTHICISKLNIIGLDNGLSPGQCWAINWTNVESSVKWTRPNKVQWNINWNPYISIQENAFENALWKITIMSWPKCVKEYPGNFFSKLMMAYFHVVTSMSCFLLCIHINKYTVQRPIKFKLTLIGL